MKLSHESKVRLGVGVGAFVLIIGLVFGISRLLAHSDMVRTTGILSGHLSDFDEDDSLNSGNYSARPQQLSSTTFDADEFRYLDFDINAASVDVKVVDGNKARVIERGRVAKGMDASKAATQNIASVEDSTLKVSQFGSDDGKAIDRSVTVELPRCVAEHLKGVNVHVGSGDLQIAGVICDGFDLFLGSGDVEFTGSVTDALSAEVGSGDATFELYQAPAKSMDVSVGTGDVEMTVPNSTGFKASLTLGCGDFESDFLPLGYDGETILNHEFDNGDKSATYRFKVGSGDMSFDPE
ncbi:MAG: DUF4097 family beta strand repeat-containing protein [Collinsella sp.]|nr:DUF4097 family beta strand repeat-containing protein [Collinsella sp.]